MAGNGATGAAAAREVKISCRNIWKVYGPECDSYFDNRSGAVDDPAGLCERMRIDSHVVAASNVTFDVRVGEIFIIMGLSGSGKSTMVRCLSRLVEPTAGEVLLDGSDLLKASEHELIVIRRHKMGMVFQNFGLLPHLSVLENVAFPLKVQGKSRSERETRAQEMIELVGLEGRENAFPRQLSGGQQQRVGIARSLAVEPELWFLDEPFSALDPLIRRQMQDEFLRLQKMLHKTIVFITHDFLEALRLADRIVIMKDGRVVQMGTPADLVLRPADDYVAEFTKDVPRVRVITAGEIMESGGNGLDPANGVAAETTLEDLMPQMASHPEGLAILDDGGAVIGRVTPQDIVRALAAADAAAS
jgi:glycine betaine/proline transport system ATP-binding protein